MSKFESGIMMGFENNQFVIGIFDEVFVEEEIKALKRNSCTLYYLSKGIIDLFLINIDDSLETSDIPFCAEDYRDDLGFMQSLDESFCYKVKISYIDLDGNEVASRSGTMDNVMSSKLREAVKKQLKTSFDEELYEISLAKLQAKYEPFEMEEMADASCKI